MARTTPWLRTAKLIIHPPVNEGGQCRYALTAFRISPEGMQSGKILLDGVLYGVEPSPDMEGLLLAFDAAIRNAQSR